MLTPRENMMAIFNREKPDYVGDFMSAMQQVPDPCFLADQIPQDGELHLDSWGTTKQFPPEAPGAHPMITPENVVIKDIEHWRDYVTFPKIKELDWTDAIEFANNVDRSKYFCGMRASTGLFERSHFWLSMEEAFCDYLEYPDEMKDLLNAIADWKIEEIQYEADVCHVDSIFFQDDWGSKQNLFLPPDVWRDIIKPIQKRISDVIHENNILYVHHADCICEPIVQDMVEIGIDIWQGVIPENNIVKIQEVTEGKLAMIGGIDVPGIDIVGTPEEKIRGEVRRAIDTYCPAGRFYPAFPAGCAFHKEIDDIARDELERYGREWVEKNF